MSAAQEPGDSSRSIDFSPPIRMTARQIEVLSLMETAALSNSPEQVEAAVDEFCRTDFTPEFVPMLIRLLSLDWHTQHEKLVQIMQACGDPRAIEILTSTAVKKFPYLDFDEGDGLARKCTWALADIGTDEARRALQNLAALSPDSLLAGFAQRRLDRWVAESPRKGFPSQRSAGFKAAETPPAVTVERKWYMPAMSFRDWMHLLSFGVVVWAVWQKETNSGEEMDTANLKVVVFVTVIVLIGYAIYKKRQKSKNPLQ